MTQDVNVNDHGLGCFPVFVLIGLFCVGYILSDSNERQRETNHLLREIVNQHRVESCESEAPK